MKVIEIIKYLANMYLFKVNTIKVLEKGLKYVQS